MLPRAGRASADSVKQPRLTQQLLKARAIVGGTLQGVQKFLPASRPKRLFRVVICRRSSPCVRRPEFLYSALRSAYRRDGGASAGPLGLPLPSPRAAAVGCGTGTVLASS